LCICVILAVQNKENQGVADRAQPLQSSILPSQPKPVQSSSQILRNRMAFFSVPSQPVRINARAFLGLEPPPLSEPADKQQEVEEIYEKLAEKEEKPASEPAAEEKSSSSAKEPESSRKRHGRNEPSERTKRWRKRRKKRRVTGHVTGGGGVAVEKHGALPVVSIDGASSDEDEDEDVGDVASVGDDAIDKAPELKDSLADVDEAEVGFVEDAAVLGEQPDSSGLPDERQGGEVVSLEDESQQLEVSVSGQRESPEETSVTVCDAVDDDLSESGSEIVEELCIGGDEDNDDDDVNETEYLADGRTINYNKLFAEEETTESKEEELEEEDLCAEEQQQVVDDVISSFREAGDAQPPADAANLPLTQSEERLLMFGWKEGIEDDADDFGDRSEEDVTKLSDVAKADETDEVFLDPGKEVVMEGKGEVLVSAAKDLNTESGLSDHHKPPSRSPDQTSIAVVPTEKRAPRAEVDSFSDDDLELCVLVPSYAPVPVGVTSSVEVEKAVPTADENQDRDTSSNLDNPVATNTDNFAKVSDIVLDNSVCQESAQGVSRVEYNGDVEIPAVENVQMSMQSLPQDSSRHSAQLEINTVPLCVEETSSVEEKKQDSQSTTSHVIVLPSPIAPLSIDSSQLAKLDPITRIDRLLESLSSSRIGPVSPSLLMSDDVFLSSKEQSGKPGTSLEDSSKVENSVSPASRLDRLADTSVSEDHSVVELSDIRDESRIVEFKVEDQSGTEQTFQVDESFVNVRDKQRQQQVVEKESLSDVSFTATTDSAADQSITSRNTDESSSSGGTQEVATCPAALMAATDDSLSLDLLASISFDDILSADNVDGEINDRRDISAESTSKDQHASSELVCNGICQGETGLTSAQLHAIVVNGDAGKDSPSAPVVSPIRLVDAKRRFFCEPPQPVRIDPRRVFDEIPAKSTSISHGASVQTGKQLNGMALESPAAAENVPSDVSSSEQPRRRVLPALPTDQPPLDVSELLSAEELALIIKTQQSGEKGSSESPAAVDDATLVRKRPHRTEKKRPSSALVVTATEREKSESSSMVQHPASSTPKSSAFVPQRQSSHSDSTADSPSQRRERLWAFHRPKTKTKVTAGELVGDNTENSGGGSSDRKDKRRSLLAILMPSKSLDRREKTAKDLPVVSHQLSAGDAASVEPSIDRTEIIAAIREKTKSLPLEKKKLPSASEATKRSSLDKQRSKSSKSRASKKSTETEADSRSKQTQRTVYEEMAPIIEGIKRVERRNREKVNIHERIRAVAPPPAKAPFTALLPPKADSEY